MSLKIEELHLRDIPDEGDPLVWLRRHREEISQKYPSVEALCEYYEQFESVEDALARIREKVADKKRKVREIAVT